MYTHTHTHTHTPRGSWTQRTPSLSNNGLGVCRRERVEGNQGGGSLGRRCALREPDAQVDPRRDGDGSSPSQLDARLKYLERSVGASKIALLQELGVLDSVLDILPESALTMANSLCNI